MVSRSDYRILYIVYRIIASAFQASKSEVFPAATKFTQAKAADRQKQTFVCVCKQFLSPRPLVLFFWILALGTQRVTGPGSIGTAQGPSFMLVGYVVRNEHLQFTLPVGVIRHLPRSCHTVTQAHQCSSNPVRLPLCIIIT